jgi:hypothetical protein
MDPLARFVQSEASQGAQLLQTRLAEIEKAQESISARVDAFAVAIDQAIKSSLRAARSSQALRTWTFDARMPNTAFQQVGLPERDAAGTWFRWVTRSHELSGELDLPRGTQYRLSIVVTAFPSTDAEESFAIRADGLSLPWLTVEGGVYTTVIPTASREKLALAIGVNPFTAQEAGGRAFAFSRLELTAL